jgi:hypothetical protein
MRFLDSNIDTLKYIASRLGLFVVLKKAFGPILKRRKLKAFKKGKDKVIKELSSVFRSDGRFFLAFGTYLGAHRNGKVINGDDDFDLGVFHEDFLTLDKQLKAHLFINELMIYTGDGKPVLAKYKKYGVIVDVFVHFPEGKTIICYDHVDMNRTTSLMSEFKKSGFIVLFENVFTFFKLENCQLESEEFLCPKQESYLQEAYGFNYMIPDSGWTYTDRSIRDKSEKKGFLINE